MPGVRPSALSPSGSRSPSRWMRLCAPSSAASRRSPARSGPSPASIRCAPGSAATARTSTSNRLPGTSRPTPPTTKARSGSPVRARVARRTPSSKRKRTASMPLGTTWTRAAGTPTPPAGRRRCPTRPPSPRPAARWPGTARAPRPRAAGPRSPLAEGVLGGDGRPGAREPGREAPVHAGPVQVRVDEVVLAAPDEPHEPGQRPQVPVAAHSQVHDPYAVGAQPLGDRPGIGQRQHVAPHRHVPQQQPQLLLGAADAEAGDDVQGLDGLDRLHRYTARRSSPTWWRTCLTRSRVPPSAWLTCVRGRACGPASRPGSMAQA